MAVGGDISQFTNSECEIAMNMFNVKNNGDLSFSQLAREIDANVHSKVFCRVIEVFMANEIIVIVKKMGSMKLIRINHSALKKHMWGQNKIENVVKYLKKSGSVVFYN